MKLVRDLANLGYGSRRQVQDLLRAGRITNTRGEPLGPEDAPEFEDVRVDGEVLDPAPGLVLMLHKPVGYTCSHADAGRLVHQLLPPRFGLRKPVLSTVGRLDRDTSGLLLLTDDGALLHRIIAPRAHVAKTYCVRLAEPLRGDEAALFSSGHLLLRSESRPLTPAQLQVIGPREARITITEGRYHQVRRMFAAVGNRVDGLHRESVGRLSLGALDLGHWRLLSAAEVASVTGTALPGA